MILIRQAASFIALILALIIMAHLGKMDHYSYNQLPNPFPPYTEIFRMQPVSSTIQQRIVKPAFPILASDPVFKRWTPDCAAKLRKLLDERSLMWNSINVFRYGSYTYKDCPLCFWITADPEDRRWASGEPSLFTAQKKWVKSIQKQCVQLLGQPFSCLEDEKVLPASKPFRVTVVIMRDTVHFRSERDLSQPPVVTEASRTAHTKIKPDPNTPSQSIESAPFMRPGESLAVRGLKGRLGGFIQARVQDSWYTYGVTCHHFVTQGRLHASGTEGVPIEMPSMAVWDMQLRKNSERMISIASENEFLTKRLVAQEVAPEFWRPYLGRMEILHHHHEGLIETIRRLQTLNRDAGRVFLSSGLFVPAPDEDDSERCIQDTGKEGNQGSDQKNEKDPTQKSTRYSLSIGPQENREHNIHDGIQDWALFRVHCNPGHENVIISKVRKNSEIQWDPILHPTGSIADYVNSFAPPGRDPMGDPNHRPLIARSANKTESRPGTCGIINGIKSDVNIKIPSDGTRIRSSEWLVMNSVAFNPTEQALERKIPFSYEPDGGVWLTKAKRANKDAFGYELLGMLFAGNCCMPPYLNYVSCAQGFLKTMKKALSADEVRVLPEDIDWPLPPPLQEGKDNKNKNKVATS